MIVDKDFIKISGKIGNRASSFVFLSCLRDMDIDEWRVNTIRYRALSEKEVEEVVQKFLQDGSEAKSQLH